MTAALHVPGAVNLRDVGGLPAGSGRTRHGVLLRSGALHRLGDEDRDALAALGLRRIVDLRDDDEVAREPSALDERLPVPDRVPLFLGSADSFFVHDISLRELYRQLVRESGEGIAVVARAVVAGGPVLVHCTAGKDRTGVSVALVLAAAGVDRDAVVADYARTEAALPAERNRRLIAWLRAAHPHAQHVEELVARSPESAMLDLLEHVDRRYGSAADYLLAAGVSEDDVAALRRVLVDER
ncbi:tyrosine-protein phosphatase [Microbacterium sp. GXF7504]